MSKEKYASNVFVNVPFDDDYLELGSALVFAIFDCGFTPRCALEENNSAAIRFDKLIKLITESQYGVHDISRTELDASTQLPRFNMPFELGLFLGVKNSGSRKHKDKNCLILDFEKYRYQTFISDISGQDISAHENKVDLLVAHIRNWLSYTIPIRDKVRIPGGEEIIRRYELFRQELPEMCNQIKVRPDELTFNDYAYLVSAWIKENSWS